MKNRLKMYLGLFGFVALFASVVIGLQVRRTWNGYHDTQIVVAGPFDSHIPNLYPDRKKDIQQWFVDELAPGITRKEAKTILSKSFTSDLTTGKATKIDEIGSLAGGSSTTVKLFFDVEGRFETVEIQQTWVYL